MFDFGSPNAFLSQEAIPAIEKRTGVKFEYVPILLGGIFKATNNKSPAETLAGVKNKREFHAVETERFVRRFQVQPYVWNPFFPVNTLNLMRAAIAAQVEGVFETYVDAAFHHMWREPKKMDDPDVAVLFRPRRAAELASAGLVIKSPNGDVTLKDPPRVEADKLKDKFDVVLLSCKAFDLDDAINSFAAAVGPNTAIIPMLNGM